jgi:class 3 adenylate cyclase/tetratricopeptide (TPR) repeat protein/ABC-type transport system involved in cytochrome c biogenesis ATPase subunit
MRFCGACGADLSRAAGAHADSWSEGERRHLVVMFCDVVESTVLAGGLDPEEWRDVLDDYHTACAAAVERFDGHVAQYQGDGVIAYFGYPRAHEDDAERGVLAAGAILELLEGLNVRLSAQLGLTLELRIGLHAGLVVTGPLGALESGRHGAAGETIHIAARIQALADPGTVLVSEAVLTLLGSRVDVEALGPHELKGVARPIALYRMRRSACEGARGERAEVTPSPLVDRTRELRLLLDLWAGARNGHGRAAHVIGEAGIGKTRLVRELRDFARRDGGAERVLRCSPHHSTTVLYPVTHLIEELAGIDRDAPAAVQMQQLRSLLERSGEETRQAAPMVADLLGIPGAAAATTGQRARDARNGLLHALASLLVSQPDGRPLLLAAEDLHWADPTTVELVGRVVPRLATRQVVFVITSRDSLKPPWSAVEVELGRLSPVDVRALVAAGPGALDERAVLEVEQATEGVPLFVEEMTKALAVAGAEAADSRVPPTLQGLLSERLDRLRELAPVIDVAAVLGREFDRAMVDALAPLDRDEVGAAIDRLAAEDVLRPVEGSRGRIEFHHPLLQEAAYERLLRRRRRRLHAQVAELLAGRPGIEPERIAYHWTSAGAPASALALWAEAGRRALDRAAFPEAAEHFRMAVECLDETAPGPDADDERAELLTYLGVALQAGRTPAARVDAIYAKARTALTRLGARERLVPVIRGLQLLHVARAEYELALEDALEMLAMGELDGRPEWLAEGRYYAGWTRWLRGELDRARADLEACVELYVAPPAPDPFLQGQSDPGVGALAYLANLLWSQGHLQEAQTRSDECIVLAEQLGQPVSLAHALGMRAGLLLVQSDWEQLPRVLEGARAYSVERNIGHWSTVCTIWSEWIAGLAADPLTHAQALRATLDGYTHAGGRIARPHFLTLYAGLLLNASEPALALDALRVGQEHIDAVGERFYEPELQRLLARVLLSGETPDAQAAEAAYEHSIASAHAQGARIVELRAAVGLTLLQQRDGGEPQAMTRVRELCESFPADLSTPDLVRARLLAQPAPRAGWQL